MERVVGAPQTFAEKVIARHTRSTEVIAGALVGASVDFVVSDELSFPEVIEGFYAIGAERVFDGSRICIVADHETPARDILAADRMRRTRAFAAEMGIEHVYDAGRAGIIHVIVPERALVGPGELMVGYDSHVLTAGAVGAFAVGVGATDAAVALAFGEIWLRVPESVRILIEGQPGPWASAKDVALKLTHALGQDGCMYRAIEFGGSYADGLPLDGRLTLTNMAIEIGAKSAAIRPDTATLEYLAARASRSFEPVWSDPDATFAAVHEIDVSGLGPLVALPDRPDRVVPVEDAAGEHLDQVFLGSCTNGRLCDLREAAEILRGRTVHPGTRLIIVPGSPEVLRDALSEGLISVFVEAGAVVGSPGCGPCAGIHMGVLAEGEVGLATGSRNFPGRMGSRESSLYLSGPSVAAASAVAGVIAHPAEVVGT